MLSGTSVERGAEAGLHLFPLLRALVYHGQGFYYYMDGQDGQDEIFTDLTGKIF